MNSKFGMNPNRIPLLEHGYIQCIDTWGSDEMIIESARMSTNRGFEGWGRKVTGDLCRPNGEPIGRDILPSYLVEAWQNQGKPDTLNFYINIKEEPGDEKLLAYLWNNKHTTPFEVAGATFEICAPIMVYREWHRHRTQSYNEQSARYEPLLKLDYMPSIPRLMLAQGKQGGKMKDTPDLTEENAAKWLAMLDDVYKYAQHTYDVGLAMGVPKELARLPVTVGRFTRMRASANLLNWFRFLGLRKPSTAQWEIRQYAIHLEYLLGSRFPRSVEVFNTPNPIEEKEDEITRLNERIRKRIGFAHEGR